MSAAPLRWGILSTAEITEELMPAFAGVEDAELAAVASRSPERAADYASRHGIERSYGSYQELLDDGEVDCVYIPLPNGLHAEWTTAALEAGKHVLCEKPLTPTAAEAQALFDLAQARGLILMEAYMYRHHPQTKRLREIYRDGILGEPRSLRMWFHFKVADPSADIRYDAGLAGGALRDLGGYCINLANYLVGAEPDTVGAAGRFVPGGVDETFAATLGYGAELVALFDCGLSSPLRIGVELTGSEGSATVPTPWYPHQPPMSIALDRGGERELIEVPGPNSYLLEVENFCAAVRGLRPPEIPAEETVRNLRTIERLLETARRGG